MTNSSNKSYSEEDNAAQDVHLTQPFFLVTAILSFVGNLLVLLLFLKKRTWLKKAHNCLLFALALQDVLTALCLIIVPPFIVPEGSYGTPQNAFVRELYCRLVWSQYLIFFLGITSIYTCVMLSFERWMAVVKPVYYRKFIQSRSQIAALVIFPWIAAFLIEFATLFRLNNREVWKRSTVTCVREYPNETSYPGKVSLALFMFLGTIAVPGILVVASYVQIIKHVRRSRRVAGCSNEYKSSPKNRTRRILRRVTVVALIASSSIILCWLPSQIYVMLVHTGLARDNMLLHRLLKLLAFSNSLLNPFIYCFSKDLYRNVCREVLLQLTRVFRKTS